MSFSSSFSLDYIYLDMHITNQQKVPSVESSLQSNDVSLPTYMYISDVQGVLKLKFILFPVILNSNMSVYRRRLKKGVRIPKRVGRTFHYLYVCEAALSRHIVGVADCRS